MKWRCWQTRRQVDRSVAVGRTDGHAAGDHAVTCDACRQYQAELHGLRSRLQALAAAAPDAPDVEASVWRAIDRRVVSSHPLSIARIGLGGLATAALVGIIWTHWPGLASWLTRQPKQVTVAEKHLPARQGDAVIASVHDLKRPTVKSNLRVRDKKMSAIRTALTRATHERKRRTPRRDFRLAGPRAKKFSPVERLRRGAGDLPPQLVWAAWGAWYEQRGEFDRAVAAYAAANQAAPASTTASFMYDAGRAAECAGDVATAVDYYAKMLTRASGAKPKADKGAHVWTESSDAA